MFFQYKKRLCSSFSIRCAIRTNSTYMFWRAKHLAYWAWAMVCCSFSGFDCRFSVFQKTL